MNNLLNKQRYGAMTSVVTSLLIASGCRSAAVNSGPGYSTGSGPVVPPPVYRSFERSPSPYDENSPSPVPQQSPPAVLPMPGYSEPEVPPPPSAQKSKWNLLPSGFKFPSMSRQNNQVNQTSAKSSDQKYSARIGKRDSKLTASQDQNTDLAEEIVLPRSTTPQLDSKRTSPTSMNVDVVEAPALQAPSASDAELDHGPIILPQIKTPINTRYGVIRQWPSGRIPSYSRATDNGAGESNATLGTTSDLPSSSSSGEVPQLLPPSQ